MILISTIGLASVMQTGAGKTTVVPMRYAEEGQAGRGWMARAAKVQGRG
jgi:hypothetical protein